jgi:hypothetical protein
MAIGWDERGLQEIGECMEKARRKEEMSGMPARGVEGDARLADVGAGEWLTWNASGRSLSSC